MPHERRRAALAVLCVFAVAFAATLFPASGFGDRPAGVGIGDGSDAPADAEGAPDTATMSAPDTDQPTATTTGRSGGGLNDGGRSTEATTTTTTATETTTAAGDTDTGGRTGPLGAIATAVLSLASLVVLLVIVGFWTGTLAVAASAGLVPVTVVVGETPVGELAGSVPTRTMALVVGLSTSVPRLLDDAAGLTRAVGGSFATVLGAAGRGAADAVRIGAQGLTATVTAVPHALAGLGAGAGIFASLGNVSVPRLGRGRDRDDGRSRAEDRPDVAEETAPPSVEEAWATLRDRTPVRNRDVRTPGEIARTAARRGYPDEAVRRLTDAFREVRYGDLPRSDRTGSARSALDRLRDYWRDDE